MHPSTFSIAAYDPETKSFGVAVQSKFLAVGSAVPWATHDAGAIATQAWANTSYGPDGLALLRSGMTAEATVNRLTSLDEGRNHRQLGIVDTEGRAFAHTGSACMDWAGHVIGEHFTCQGNILTGSQVVESMAHAYETTKAPFADRLMAALKAGQAAGGDKRGQESAAILVVRKAGGYGSFNDRAIDLRVDDHPTPIEELDRILRLHRLYFEKVRPEDAIRLEGAVLDEVGKALRRAGFMKEGRSLEEALQSYLNTENFEDRVHGPGFVDRQVLEYMRQNSR